MPCYASAGGWTLARGGGARHFAGYDRLPLNAAQQARVEELAKKNYGPCCNNSTYLPC